MQEHDNDKSPESSKPASESCESPAIEVVIGRDELERETHYAGGLSQVTKG